MVKIQGPSGGGVTHSYRVIEPIGDNAFNGTLTPVIGDVILRPIQFPVEMTIDTLGAIFTIGGNGNAIMGLYADGPGGDTPEGGAVVFESASIGTVATVQEFPVTSGSIFGLHWLALEVDNITDRVGVSAFTTIIENNATLVGSRYARAGGFGALTDPCPAVVAKLDRNFLSYVLVASVP